MSSVILQLGDSDIETVNHMIRRDDMPDAKIARRVEELLGKSIGPNEPAKIMVLHRYRASKHYRAWAERWYRERIDMEKRLAEVRARYDIVSEAVKGGTEQGFDGVSKVLLGRLLTQAVEANDEELKAASGAKGWVANAIRLALGVQENRLRKKVEELKAELKRMIEKPDGGKLDTKSVVDRVDQILGLKAAT